MNNIEQRLLFARVGFDANTLKTLSGWIKDPSQPDNGLKCIKNEIAQNWVRGRGRPQNPIFINLALYLDCFFNLVAKRLVADCLKQAETSLSLVFVKDTELEKVGLFGWNDMIYQAFLTRVSTFAMAEYIELNYLTVGDDNWQSVFTSTLFHQQNLVDKVDNMLELQLSGLSENKKVIKEVIYQKVWDDLCDAVRPKK